MEPTCKLETITPEIARKLLETNKNNRPVRRAQVDQLVWEINNDRWEVTGETVKIDKDDKLLDAQHRLLAIIEANKPVKTLVARGLNPEAFKIIDTGRSRSSADILHMEGIENALGISAMVKFIIPFKQGRYSDAIETAARGGLKSTNRIVSEFVGKHKKSLSESYLYGYTKSNKIVRPGMMAGMHYILKSINAEEADDFCHRLIDGTKLIKNHPIYVLREKFLADMRSKYKMSHSMKAALICKAWNLYRANKKVDNVSYWPGKEPFPKPI